MKYLKTTVFAATIGLILTLGFQNCGRAKFRTVQDLTASSLGLPGGTPIICDPFSTPGGCGSTPPATGLLGNVYYYPNGQFVDDYINLGVRLGVRIQLSEVDVPTRSWTAGFSLPTGAQLVDDNNQPLIEWFAMDLKGFIELPGTIPAGDYQFALQADDGAILDIDGVTVLSHDGLHATSWKCSPNKVTIAATTKLPVRLRYFQGPRVEIALRLLWRPWSKRTKPCDDSAVANGLTVVPAAVFTH